MSRLKKIAIIVTMVMIYFTGVKSMDVYADTAYVDEEGNDSITEAQIVSANRMTYKHKVSNNRAYYNYVKGTLSGDDEDWYKVFIMSSDEEVYLTMDDSSDYTLIEVFDTNKKLLHTFTYTGRSNAENVFRIETEKQGYYYIRIYHATSSEAKYYFTIGEPEYYLSSYTHKFDTVTLPAKGEWSDDVDLSEITSLPKKAVGYKITVSGCSTSVSSDRYFYNQYFGRWVATKTGYYYNLPVTQSSLLAQKWGIKLESSSSSKKTITPQFTIQYVYPDLPKDEQ